LSWADFFARHFLHGYNRNGIVSEEADQSAEETLCCAKKGGNAWAMLQEGWPPVQALGNDI
jgi:hypothetical protein